MVRAAVATGLIGLAAAIALTALHVLAGPAGSLIQAYWPAVLVGAGIGGLIGPTAAREPARRGVPAGLAITGLALLGARLQGVPAMALVWSAACLWAGVAVAFSGRRRASR